MVSIRLDGISKSYGEAAAVDAVSAEVKRGELFFLLGPSGCGKTTILRMIAGFCGLDAGEIYFDEKPISGVPAHRRNTSLVFQNYALWPHMSVAENVAYGLEERGVAKNERNERVERALKRVHMDRYAGRSPNQLSGGQQQRVALARALVVEPDAVLMDEPLSNLDARLRLEMRHEILRIHRETGITMLYVTHDQKEALSMADRLAVMSMGRIEQVGTPRQLYRHPESRFVADFIGEANFIPGKLTATEGGVGTLGTEFGELRGDLPAEGAREGDELSCMVRPECLRLAQGKENNFRAVVTSTLYLGEVEQFVLEAGELELRAVVANPGEDAPGAGDEVAVSFESGDAVLLPQGGEGGEA